MGFQVAAISCLILGPRLDYWLYDWTHKEIFRFFIQLNRPYTFFWGMGVLLLWGAVILAIWSAISYFHAFWKVVGPRIMAGSSHLTGPEDSE
jgi:CDP-diacylglycerol--glycerol-3-phosphate 3-phosphatidyltransferase